MKKILILFAVMVPLTLTTATAGTISRARLNSLISDCRNYEGAERVRIGSLATAALKSVIRLSSAGDRDAREALLLMKGVRSLCILDYDDCSVEDKSRIDSRIDRALADSEVLMEAVDDGGMMRIYGTVDEDMVRDFVLWSDGALICVFGTVSLNTLATLMEND